MAKKSAFAFHFEEMADLAERFENAGGDLQQAADEALRATHDYITPNLGTEIVRHVRSGRTKGSLDKQGGVVWESPLKAYVNIGFNIGAGGLPSIFLMCGTPKMKADTKLKSAAFGAKTKRKVAEIQKEAMLEAVRKMEGTQ